MSNSRELGEQFNLSEANPDLGGGLYYAIRYTPEMLELKAHSILDRLHEWGFEFIEVGDDGIGIQPVSEGLGSEYNERVPIMAEELSVINDARDYQSNGWGVDQNTVTELVGSVKAQAQQALTDALKGGTEEKIEAFNVATMMVPTFVNDLLVSHRQNGTLTNRELREVIDLQHLGKFIEQATDGRHIILGVG